METVDKLVAVEVWQLEEEMLGNDSIITEEVGVKEEEEEMLGGIGGEKDSITTGEVCREEVDFCDI